MEPMHIIYTLNLLQLLIFCISTISNMKLHTKWYGFMMKLKYLEKEILMDAIKFIYDH